MNSINNCALKEQLSMIAKHYDPLQYEYMLKQLLSVTFNNQDFTSHSKMELHRFINDLLLGQRIGEEALKYELFKRAARQNLIAAFEIRVNNSRVDFLTINGSTTSYEIKSGLDNLDKLSKQAADYLLAFEYNYVVVDEKHLEKARKLLPSSFGILCFKNGRKKEFQPANRHHEMDPIIQLSLLTKKEISKAFQSYNSPSQICTLYTDDEINRRFKTTLKNRYRTRWEFLKNNREHILPIDIQFFFNSNIAPELVYS